MKLTNRQLYDYARSEHDDTNGEFWKPAVFVRNYEAARLRWIAKRLPLAESDEQMFRDLEVFMAEPHNFGSTNRVALQALIYPYLGKTAVHGEWNFVCNGRTTPRTLPIPPRRIEVLIPALTDFTEQPEDTDPVYIEEREGEFMYLRILSRNVPSNLTVHYVTEPKPFRLIEEPSGFTQEGYSQQLQIVSLAMFGREITVENYNKAQAEMQKTALVGA